MKIYTRTGDTGETSLFGGTRVGKDDARVHAYGEVDELNAHLGLARASGGDSDVDAELVRLQRELFALGAQLADPDRTVSDKSAKAHLGVEAVTRLEQLIDRLEADLPPLRHFILAGGTPCGAALHVARAVCRRAERAMVSLGPALDPVLLRYINRLSDLLFVLARTANHRAGVEETPW
jgi:cob(I)alamin adenosyltransferase